MAEPSNPDATADPVYRAAAIDLLAVVAYGELSAFERLVHDARMATRLADRIALERMAADQFAAVEPLLERITELGADPLEALAPFEGAFDTFHSATAPSTFVEGLVKAFVGDALAADFYREIAALLDEDTRRIVGQSLDRHGQTDFIIGRVREAITDDPKILGPLALWARRLMGEALAQAQHVAVDRDALMGLLTNSGAGPSLDLAALGGMFARITELHKARMAALGLEP